MDFQTQKIAIQTKTGTRTIDAVVGIGSGLAYQEDEAEENDEEWDEEEDVKIYSLTHLASGLSLSNYGVDDEDVAQRWLELVASLVDWNQDLPALEGQLSSDLRGKVHAAIEQAYIDVFGDPDEEYDETEP